MSATNQPAAASSSPREERIDGRSSRRREDARGGGAFSDVRETDGGNDDDHHDGDGSGVRNDRAAAGPSHENPNGGQMRPPQGQEQPQQLVRPEDRAHYTEGPPPQTATEQQQQMLQHPYIEAGIRDNNNGALYPDYRGPFIKPLLGNSSSICNGCCICPADGSRGFIVMFFIIAPVAVFVSSVVPYKEWYTSVIAVILCFIDCMMLFFASCCDPGILHPLKRDEPVPERQILVLEDGSEWAQDVCRTCKILRPPRSSHCRFCDYCVSEYDHHCGVVGSCVAERTFRFFTLFFYVTTILALFVFVRCVIFLIKMDFDEAQETHFGRWQMAAAICLCIYTVLAGCCVIGQLAMYTHLACTGKTQKDTHGSRTIEGKGCSCANWCCRLFGPMAPSLITAEVLEKEE